MKRIIGILAGLAALGSIVYLGSKLWAQAPVYAPAPPAATVPPPVTRIALINIGQVIKNYHKFMNSQVEIKKQQDGYKSQYDHLNNQVTQKQVDLKKLLDPTNPNPSVAVREQLERDIRDLQRRMQDLGEEAKLKIGKMQFDRLVQTYKEVQDAVRDYARPRNIELVLHYNDGVGSDQYIPALLQQKLAGACWPMYMHPGMDITAGVTDMLNRGNSVGVPPTR